MSIKDGAAETSVSRQVHGFQRALIIAALKYLADRRRPESGTRTLCLAVEEPELFQHPPQARTFAKVLRDPAGYHQVRRLTRDAGAEHPVTKVRQVTEDELCRSLEGLVKEEAEGRAERNGVNLGAEGITFVDVTGRDNLLLSRKRESVRNLGEEQRREKETAFEQQARKISGRVGPPGESGSVS
ncbi:AAA family ATPase [Streptomyces sp. NPDC094032]|uniref:AAA family ATPase n=1 Tax=Streptomyces sp. NPDC094032 TaxID=3155308 RepID=UPI003330B7FC